MKNKILSTLFITACICPIISNASEITGTISSGGGISTGLTATVIGNSNTGGGGISGTVTGSSGGSNSGSGGSGGGGGSPTVITGVNTAGNISPTTKIVSVFTKELKIGNTDIEVKDLQKFLNTNGYIITKIGAGSKGKENNTFGSLTKSALIKFQKANKLSPNGMLDKSTKDLLNKLIGPKTIITTPVNTTNTDKAFTRDLQIGSNGIDVKNLQNILIKKMIGPAAKALAKNGASNYFGALTKNALMEFQKSKGISPATGNFGPKTRAVIGL